LPNAPFKKKRGGGGKTIPLGPLVFGKKKRKKQINPAIFRGKKGGGGKKSKKRMADLGRNLKLATGAQKKKKGGGRTRVQRGGLGVCHNNKNPPIFFF